MAVNYLAKNLIPAATVETTLYTVPAAATGILNSLRVTNDNSTSSLLTVNLYPGGGATAHALLRTYSLPVRGTMDVFSGIPCTVETGDIIKVQSSEDDVAFHLSYLEVDRT